MNDEIYLPSAEEVGEGILKAWERFKADAKEAGYSIDDQTAEGWLKDTFVAGFCEGWSELIHIIRDQREAEREARKAMGN